MRPLQRLNQISDLPLEDLHVRELNELWNELHDRRGISALILADRVVGGLPQHDADILAFKLADSLLRRVSDLLRDRD